MDDAMHSNRGLVQRAIGAAMLQVDVYEEVEADTTATSQAAIVVTAAAMATAVAASSQGLSAVIAGVLNAFIAWLIWAAATNFVGTRLFDGTADWGELLRTLGFAQAPGVLLIFGVVPLLGWLVSFVVGLWMLATGVVAIRQALDFGTGKAIVTALVAALLLWVIAAVFGLLFGVSVGAFGGLGRT